MTAVTTKKTDTKGVHNTAIDINYIFLTFHMINTHT